MEDIPSHDSSSIQSEGEVPAESEKSNQQLNLINNSNSNLNELNNVSNNGPEAFMKTDDLIDLFSIDPATGRAKVEEENDNIFGDIENHDYNDTKEDNFEEFYNDLNPFEEIKQHKAIDDFEFEFKDPEIRREIPIEEFNPSSVQIHNNPTKEEKHTLKFKNFEMEKWVDRDVSETSSQRGRTSILSSESNSKVTRNSDGIHIHSKNLMFNEETSMSNTDIEDFISRERSMKEDKANSDLMNDDEYFLRKQISDCESNSPYALEHQELEHPMSNNSIDSKDQFDSGCKFDEEILNPVSIFNEDYEDFAQVSDEMKNEAIVNDIMLSLIHEIRASLFPTRDNGKIK